VSLIRKLRVSLLILEYLLNEEGISFLKQISGPFAIVSAIGKL